MAARPGNLDRGWNDPPMFGFEAPITTTTPRRNMLNKRVAYPLSSNSNSNATVSPPANVLNPAEGPPKLANVQILPPAENTSTPEPLPVVIPTLLPNPKEDLVVHPGVAVRQPVCETMNSVQQRLGVSSETELSEYIDDGLKHCIERCRDRLQVRTLEDITKRITVMQEMWAAGSLSETVKAHLGCLTKALKDEDFTEAQRLHQVLMVDHIAEVNQWMVGIKKLIHEVQLLKENSETSQPSNSNEDSVPGITLIPSGVQAADSEK
ncbi:steroid receptor RNA activator 1-like [Gigantopelta aegis]|uniref:steroid receptor RNA activator 1-like n=1 Tax=Gigantopelta aegis TaxID=1735272 RepID=UPI001B88847C|nr:steroid receptor RNA activator 1-like [Gigantopelta aegis]